MELNGDRSNVEMEATIKNKHKHKLPGVATCRMFIIQITEKREKSCSERQHQQKLTFSFYRALESRVLPHNQRNNCCKRDTGNVFLKK